MAGDSTGLAIQLMQAGECFHIICAAIISVPSSVQQLLNGIIKPPAIPPQAFLVLLENIKHISPQIMKLPFNRINGIEKENKTKPKKLSETKARESDQCEFPLWLLQIAPACSAGARVLAMASFPSFLAH